MYVTTCMSYVLGWCGWRILVVHYLIEADKYIECVILLPNRHETLQNELDDIRTA
jgi:hypothetical protein